MTLPVEPIDATEYKPRHDVSSAFRKAKNVDDLLDRLVEFVRDHVVSEQLGRQGSGKSKSDGSGLEDADRMNYDSHDLIAARIQSLPTSVSDDIILRFGPDVERLLDMRTEDIMETHNRGGELADPKEEAKRLDERADRLEKARTDLARELTTDYVKTAKVILDAIGIPYEALPDTNAFEFKREDLARLLEMVQYEQSIFQNQTPPSISSFVNEDKTLQQVANETPCYIRQLTSDKRSEQSAAMSR